MSLRKFLPKSYDDDGDLDVITRYIHLWHQYSLIEPVGTSYTCHQVESVCACVCVVVRGVHSSPRQKGKLFYVLLLLLYTFRPMSYGDPLTMTMVVVTIVQYSIVQSYMCVCEENIGLSPTILSKAINHVVASCWFCLRVKLFFTNEKRFNDRYQKRISQTSSICYINIFA